MQKQKQKQVAKNKAIYQVEKTIASRRNKLKNIFQEMGEAFAIC